LYTHRIPAAAASWTAVWMQRRNGDDTIITCAGTAGWCAAIAVVAPQLQPHIRTCVGAATTRSPPAQERLVGAPQLQLLRRNCSRTSYTRRSGDHTIATCAKTCPIAYRQ
jgi:cysteine synthase